MAQIYPEISRTFSEFLLLPNYTEKKHKPSNVNLETPIVKYHKGDNPSLTLKLPLVSAVMQAVSDERLAIALAKSGGISFIFHSQTIEKQASMVRKVKSFRAGFVKSDSNIRPEAKLHEAQKLSSLTCHNNIAVTNDGTDGGLFLGMLRSKDIPYNDSVVSNEPVSKYMITKDEMLVADLATNLDSARDIIWKHKLDCLPILDKEGHLLHLVFRRDFSELKNSPYESLDFDRRLLVGAGLNTHDYEDRIPALLDAGVDIFVIDSSDGFSEWQSDLLNFVRTKYGDNIKIGAGNVVDKEGFRFLVNAGADFVKIGIGGGSICITREQKGIGRGSVSALLEIVTARDDYFDETGIYIPICIDGGISLDYQIVIAISMGADFVMMGRYFAKFDESPGRKVYVKNRNLKEYWAEGSNRAANWARYDLGDGSSLKFEEGVDGFVPYAGDLHSNVELTRAKITSTMCNCGALSLKELREKARLVISSTQSNFENSAQIERRQNSDDS